MDEHEWLTTVLWSVELATSSNWYLSYSHNWILSKYHRRLILTLDVHRMSSSIVTGSTLEPI